MWRETDFTAIAGDSVAADTTRQLPRGAAARHPSNPSAASCSRGAARSGGGAARRFDRQPARPAARRTERVRAIPSSLRSTRRSARRVDRGSAEAGLAWRRDRRRARRVSRSRFSRQRRAPRQPRPGWRRRSASPRPRAKPTPRPSPPASRAPRSSASASSATRPRRSARDCSSRIPSFRSSTPTSPAPRTWPSISPAHRSVNVMASDVHDNPGAAFAVRSGASARITHNVFQRNGASASRAHAGHPRGERRSHPRGQRVLRHHAGGISRAERARSGGARPRQLVPRSTRAADAPAPARLARPARRAAMIAPPGFQVGPYASPRDRRAVVAWRTSSSPTTRAPAAAWR